MLFKQIPFRFFPSISFIFFFPRHLIKSENTSPATRAMINCGWENNVSDIQSNGAYIEKDFQSGIVEGSLEWLIGNQWWLSWFLVSGYWYKMVAVCADGQDIAVMGLLGLFADMRDIYISYWISRDKLLPWLCEIAVELELSWRWNLIKGHRLNLGICAGNACYMFDEFVANCDKRWLKLKTILENNLLYRGVDWRREVEEDYISIWVVWSHLTLSNPLQCGIIYMKRRKSIFEHNPKREQKEAK